MTRDPNSDDASPGNADSLNNGAHTPDKLRNPRATRKGPDMPEDHAHHRIDPEEDYAKPDGSER